jgi:arginine kinase
MFSEKLSQLEKATESLTDLKLEVRRNFRGMKFMPIMTKENKLQVERRVVEVLGELCGKYHQVAKMGDVEKDWLLSVGVNVERSEFHDAAGLNDDYPVGRGVFIEDAKEFIVLVNFEDHI